MTVPYYPTLTDALATILDLRVTGMTEVADLLFTRAPRALASNPTIPLRLSARYLGEDGAVIESDLASRVLGARWLEPARRSAFLATHHTDPVTLAFLRNQSPSRHEIHQIVDNGIGSLAADYILRSSWRVSLFSPAQTTDIIDHAPPLTRLYWLARSSNGEYGEYGARWIAGAPSQLSPWVPRTIAVQRPDLLQSLVASSHRRVREGAARSGGATNHDVQVRLLHLPEASASAGALQGWMVEHGAVALALVQSTAMVPALLDELAGVSARVHDAAGEHGALSRRRAGVLSRAVEAARGSDSASDRRAFRERELVALERNEKRLQWGGAHNYREAPRVALTPIPVSAHLTQAWSSEDLVNWQLPAPGALRWPSCWPDAVSTPLTQWLCAATGGDWKIIETMLALAPEWSLTLGELIDTARTLHQRAVAAAQ